MGFSVSASTAIVFLAVVVSFTTVYPAAANGLEAVTDARQESTDRALAQQNTAINLTGTTYDGAADTLTITVENVGSTDLSVAATDVLVDNVYRQGSRSVAGDADTDLWLPGETLTVTVSNVTTRPDRVRVVTEHGVADGGGV